MTELQNSNCPHCGSPLDVKPGDTRIKCAYCGSSIIVSEHEDSTPEVPNFTFKIDDSTYKEIGTVGKVTAGIALSSIVIPIVIAVAALCVGGIIIFFVIRGIHILPMEPTFATPTLIIAPTAAPATEFPTPTPPATPTAEPTPTPFPTPIPFANVLFRDDFSKISSGWDQVHETDYTLEYKDGAYHVVVGAQDGGESVWIGDNYTNLSVEVEANQTAGPDDAFVGVSCRVKQGVGGYGFEFSQNGTYGIYKYTQGSPSALGENSLDPNTVNANGTNAIEGVCAGSTLTLILNGEALMQVDDPTYTSGGAGVIVRTGYSGEAGIDVLFNQFVVKGP